MLSTPTMPLYQSIFPILAFLPQELVTSLGFSGPSQIILGAALLGLVHRIPGSVHQLTISRLFFAVSTLPHHLYGDAHSAAYLDLGWKLVRVGTGWGWIDCTFSWGLVLRV